MKDVFDVPEDSTYLNHGLTPLQIWVDDGCGRPCATIVLYSIAGNGSLRETGIAFIRQANGLASAPP
jgi:hypothetical protein